MQMLSSVLLKLAPDALPVGEAFSISITGIVVVLLMLALLALLVQLLSKTIQFFEKKTQKKPAEAEKTDAHSNQKTVGTPLAENQSAGSLDLNGVDEKTAAVLMAIVSHKSGIPLNRLAFKSIKKIEK